MQTENSFVDAPGADGAHRTYCRLCEAQCGMIVEVADGRIAKVSPDRGHPTSEGHICIKGPGMAQITYDPDRVLTPLKRIGAPGEFAPVSWDEALDDIAARLKAVLDRDGGQAIGMYGGNPGSFATLHGAYAAMFVRSLGGTRTFNSLHIDTGAKNLAQEVLFGTPMDWTWPDLEDCDFLIMLGANPMVSHMSLIAEPRALHKLNAIHARGGVVVIDPRRTETAERFEHVPVLPDSDVWLVGAMLNHLFASGLAHDETLRARTSGWEQLRDAIRVFTLERASARCGVPVDMIVSLTERFARARTAACYGRVGTNRGRYSTLLNIFIESLNVVAGRFGQPGGWTMGLSPFTVPGAEPRKPTPYGTLRSRVADLPMIMGITPGGLLAAEITTPGAPLKALFVDSGNPVHSYPGGDKTAAALEDLDLCVALDFYVTETSRHAHYILPATTFYEREDLTDLWVTNAPRPWVQFTPAVIPPLGEARQEYDIYNAILARLGKPPVLGMPNLMDVADHMLRSGVYGDQYGAKPGGLSIAKLRAEHPEGVRVKDRVDAAASWERLQTEDGRARLWHTLTAQELARLLAEDAERPRDALYLFGRRKLGSMNSWMHNVERLVRSEKPTLLMHPDDARVRQIADGAMVRIASKSGSLEVEVELSDEIVPGSVNYPHGWGHQGGWKRANALPGVNINLLASADPADWEQVSGNVHVDGIPVTVLPA